MKQTDNNVIIDHLNEQQKKAVLQKEGSLLVIAGAGSGKTRVITSRIAHLILHENVDHKSIVALTFTNKAAHEMQERIKQFIGNAHGIPFVGTFHAYCVRLLKMNQELLDTPFFSIIDADDQEKIIKGIMHRHHITKEVTVKQLRYQISYLKNQAIKPEEQAAFLAQHPLLRDIFHAYEAEKKVSKCLDFDDLLLHGLKLFAHPSFKTSFHDTVRHVLVDEYQDTNIVQHALLQQMTLKNKETLSVDSICVVGDEDQSIYSWRGATVTNMINFKQDFPNTTIIKIEQNYRSIQSILDIANHVIKHNKQRNPKKLWSTKKGVNRIVSMIAASEYQEGDAIAHLCKVARHTHKLSSFAILYRTHFQSRAIEEAFIRNAIPYKIFGGIQFYERKEVKDLIAYLRLVVNPFDRPSFFRVINCPNRGLGDSFEALFYDRWAREPFLHFKDIATELIREELIKGKKAESLEQFVALFNNVHANLAPRKALEQILEQSAYISYIKESYDLEDSQTRIDNIQELMRAIEHFQSTEQGGLDQFLQDVALMQDKAHKQQEEQDAILMMTLHAAKGLEFDTVLLVGLEEGLLPSSRSLHDEDAIEEERRLFYVGITRARERLLLSKSRYRYTYGKMVDQLPSRFAREIPDNLVISQDIGHMQLHTLKQWFAQWLNIEQPIDQSVYTFGTTTQAKKSITHVQPHHTNNDQVAIWKVNQTVAHKTFGIGLIKKIEERDNITYVTVRFKSDTKTIMGSFLQKI